MTETVITAADDGRTIPLQIGDSLRSELPEIPTTGFRWSVAPNDTQIIAVEDDGYQAAGTGIGGGGQRVFRLTAKARGTTSITFSLARAWTQGPPQSGFAISVAVS